MEWMTIGPWRYALGSFGVIELSGKACGRLSPWAVYVHGRLHGTYGSLGIARHAIEAAALAEGHEVER